MGVLGDVAVGPVIAFGGLMAGLFILFPIILVEGVVMWLMKWGSIGMALRDSALANIVSTVIGVIGAFLFYNTLYGCTVQVSADGTQRVEQCGFAVSPLLGLLLAAIASILIEGFFLFYYRKLPARLTWDAVIAANVASYVLLVVGGIAWIWNFT
jgi:hypothetical protein